MSIWKDNENRILDNFEERENFLSRKLINLILIYLFLILGIYFVNDYYIKIHVEINKNQANWLKIVYWVFLIIICVRLTKNIVNSVPVNMNSQNYQLAIIVFFTFLAARIIFLSTLYLGLGAKVNFPNTPTYYFQGLMIAGLFGFISYNRIKKFKAESQTTSLVLLVIYYLGIKLIENQIS